MKTLLDRYDLNGSRILFLAGLSAFFVFFLFYPLWYAVVRALWVNGEFSLVFF